jgi:hypothetical protein
MVCLVFLHFGIISGRKLIQPIQCIWKKVVLKLCLYFRIGNWVTRKVSKTNAFSIILVRLGSFGTKFDSLCEEICLICIFAFFDNFETPKRYKNKITSKELKNTFFWILLIASRRHWNRTKIFENIFLNLLIYNYIVST